MGVTRFVADVLPENRHMLAMFEGCGYPTSILWSSESVTVAIDITRDEAGELLRAG
jgi:hypothetical protein